MELGQNPYEPAVGVQTQSTLIDRTGQERAPKFSLSIWHILLWTLFCAIHLALQPAEQASGSQNGLLNLLQPIVSGVFAVLNGTAWTGLFFLFLRRRRQRKGDSADDTPKRSLRAMLPGHWSLISGSVYALALLVLAMVGMSLPTGTAGMSYIVCIGVVSIGLGIVACFATVWVGGISWRLVFALSALANFLRGASYFAVSGSAIRLYTILFYASTWAEVAVLALMFATLLVEWWHSRKRDALHHLGISITLLESCVGWAWYWIVNTLA